MQEPWSKASLVVHQEDLSKLAIEALHRATQAVPTVACASLNQECEVHHRMNTVMPSAAHALNLQACLQTYRTGCQEAV